MTQTQKQKQCAPCYSHLYWRLMLPINHPWCPLMPWWCHLFAAEREREKWASCAYLAKMVFLSLCHLLCLWGTKALWPMSSLETDGIEVAPRTKRKMVPQFLQPKPLQAQNVEKWITENHMTWQKAQVWVMVSLGLSLKPQRLWGLMNLCNEVI